MQGERTLDPDAEGLLADGEGLADPLALALDDHALEDLRAATRALDDLEVDLDAIPGLEAGHAAQLRALERVDYGAHGEERPRADLARGRALIVADRLPDSVIAPAATHLCARDGPRAGPPGPPIRATAR